MAEYAPLLQEEAYVDSVSKTNSSLDEIEPCSADFSSKESRELDITPPSILSSRIIRYSILVIVLCSIVDGILLVVGLYRLSQSIAAPIINVDNPYLSQEDIDSLPLKNAYINFDRLYGPGGRKSTPRPPVINMARAFGHVSSQEPERKESQWLDNMWPTANGYIPLDNRRLWATSEVSTIAQFRFLDWGMENCTIVLHVPSQSDSSSHAGTHWRRLGLGAPISTRLTLHQLDTPHKLNLPKLSYSTKPRRLREIASVDLIYGKKVELPAFHCHSGSYFTVEVSCVGEDVYPGGECNLDYLAIDRELTGLYIRQTQTI